jgi:hypothetical protein
MAREAHSVVKALDLLPYHLAGTLKAYEEREKERKTPSLPAVAVAVFSAIVALGINAHLAVEQVALSAAAYLIAVLVITYVGNWIIRSVRAYLRSQEALGKTDQAKAQLLVEAFNSYAVNQYILADGLTSLSESSDTGVAERAFFAGEAVHCLDQAAQSTLALTVPDLQLALAVRFEPPLSPAKLPVNWGHIARDPVAGAITEERVRWAIGFSESLIGRLKNLPSFPEDAKLKNRLDDVQRIKVKGALKRLDDLGAAYR